MGLVSHKYLAGKKHAPCQLGRVLILGLGKSGRAVVNYLIPLLGNRVEALFVAAGSPTPESEAYADELQKRGVNVAFEDAAPCVLAERIFDEAPDRNTYTFDLAIASPGISQFSSFYTNAASVSSEVISEVEFAWRESADSSLWIAITGTNGKTTTVACTEHLLIEAGKRAKAVGNIGETCIEAVAAGDTDIYVAETSSFQLASTLHFAPNIAIVLNITPDHVNWHGSFEAYESAKMKILANLAAVQDSFAILDATDDVVRAKVRDLRSLSREERGFSYIPLGTREGISGDMRLACGSDNAAFVAEGVLKVVLGGTCFELIAADDLLIKGDHNKINALAAATAALACNLDASIVAQGLASFAPLEHRIEPCGSVGGVMCYNDSKATNVDATLKAVAAFDAQPLIVLLGGRDKGTDLAPLVEAACKHAKGVVCFGEAADRFLQAFEVVSDTVTVLSARHLEDAFDAALDVAQTGDVILLSPACASFDEFTSFEQRGRFFKTLVKRRNSQNTN